MKHLCKTAVSLLLVAVLVLSGLPVGVNAASDTEITYYGRTALSQLDNAEKMLYIYDQIVDGIANCKETIEFDLSYGITEEELTTVLDAYIRDYAHHFWLDNHYGVGGYSTGITSLYPTYTMTGTELESAKTAFESAVDEILAGLSASMSDYDKELYLHDALAARVTYIESTNAHNSYGALVEGKAVCEGYAEALQYLLHRAGIQSFIATGNAGGPHAWNYVLIDGEYYHVDLTWNDQDSALYHAYFNVSDSMIAEDHTLTPTAYQLPTCDSTDAFYFNGKDTYLDSYTVSSVGKLMKNNAWNVHVYIPGNVDTFWSWFCDNCVAIAREAGVSGGFSYGASTLSREKVLRFTNAGEPPRQTVSVITSGGVAANYVSMEDALTVCAAEGGYLRLLADCDEDFTVTQPSYLDLNGYDLTGSISGTGTLYVMDSKTDDFTVEDSDGYGTVTGTVTANIAGVPVEADCAEDGYIMIDNNGSLSFHRVSLKIKSMVLRPEQAALYFSTAFNGDEMIAQRVTSFGVALSVTGEPNETTLTNPLQFTRYGGESFGDDADSTSTLLHGIMKTTNGYNTNTRNANLQVYGRAYIELEGCGYTFGVTQHRSLRQQIEMFDAKWDTAEELQKTGALEMFERFYMVMRDWTIPNIQQNAQ